MTGGILERALKHSDVMMAVGIIGLVAMMIIPLPPLLLDMLLTANFAVALCVLMVSIYIREPLEFAVFPSLLLVATLFRLALNISSTRLILLHGHAGRVIEAFGNFVVGGDLVVGLILFLILVIIQFVVITSGSQRVAEVAARFTLDEMPGKQMAIDADLSAGLVTEDQARLRRRNIEREADFYGAMDGATKFVRGDAVAAIIIVLINIIAGMIIGMVRLGLEPGEAVRRFVLLTVGDGLVSQIPALLISTATGLVVTRSASEHDLGRDVVGQILAQPRAVGIVAVMMALFGLVPGLPTTSFLLIAAGAGLLAFYVGREQTAEDEQQEQSEAAASERDQPLTVPPPERLGIEIGYGLIPLVDQSQEGGLLGRIKGLRERAAGELGLIVPAVRIQDDMGLPPNGYRIRLRGAAIAEGEVSPSRLMAIAAQDGLDPLPGQSMIEPAFGLTAWWIEEGQRALAEARGYTVVEPDVVIATHLSELIKTHAPELLSRQDVQMMLDELRSTNPAAVTELVPELASIGQLHQALRALLDEGVPVLDFATIVESLADGLRVTDNIAEACEHVRGALGRSICEKHRGEDGTMHVYVLDPLLESQIAESLVDTSGGQVPLLEPGLLRGLLDALQAAVADLVARGHQPVVLTAPQLRRHMRGLVSRSFPDLSVMSHNELVPEVRVRSVGTVAVEAA